MLGNQAGKNSAYSPKQESNCIFVRPGLLQRREFCFNHVYDPRETKNHKPNEMANHTGISTMEAVNAAGL